MYYDDDVRRFNFLSGLVLGAVLGTGLALIVGSPRRLGGRSGRLAKRVARSAGRARGRVVQEWSARRPRHEEKVPNHAA